MSTTQWLTVRRDVLVTKRDDGSLYIEGMHRQLTLRQHSPGTHEILQILCGEGATAEELGRCAIEHGGLDELPAVYLLIHHLENAGLLCHTIRSNNIPLATLVPIGMHYRYTSAAISPECKYMLSRFAYCRKRDETLLIESPLSQAEILLHSPLASAMLHKLITPQTCQELADTLVDLPLATAEAFVQMLANAGMLIPQAENSQDQEAVAPPLALWEFHDLLLHSRSRMGRHSNPYGGTYRFVKTIPSPEALKSPMSDELIPLPTPDIQYLSDHDVPFTSVLENRRSIRQCGINPITKQELGEFLYRTARVKEIMPSKCGEVSKRPYPGGGAVYELELYAVIDRCEGLAPGIYHYRPGDHELCRLTVKERYINDLIEQAWLTIDRQSRPQVLLVITAQFARVFWKYQSMAYALILKHVGVLYQTMYLVATAMGLAPCALGGGNSDLFSAATGLDYVVEGAVGEFVLGSRAQDEGAEGNEKTEPLLET